MHQIRGPPPLARMRTEWRSNHPVVHTKVIANHSGRKMADDDRALFFTARVLSTVALFSVAFGQQGMMILSLTSDYRYRNYT